MADPYLSIYLVGNWLKQRFRRRKSVGDQEDQTMLNIMDSRLWQEQDKRLTNDRRSNVRSRERLTPQRSIAYDELIGGRISIPTEMLDHLEMYLGDSDLMEHLFICSDFLAHLDPGDLYDRKYRAGLTREQFLLRRKPC